MTNTTQRPLPWYFAPAIILVTGCMIAIINFGIRSTFGFFTLPITEAQQWPRETYSFAIAVQNLLWGAATPVAGMLADKYGSARVLMAGAVIYAIGLVGMVFSNSGLTMTFTAGLLVGVGVAMSSFSIVMAALGRLVPPEKRSWAFGLATASGPVHLARGPHHFDLWLANCALRISGCFAFDHSVGSAAAGAKYKTVSADSGRNITLHDASHW
jgi:MFS family permease